MILPTLTASLAAFLREAGHNCPVDAFTYTIPPDRSLGDICITVFGAVRILKCPPQKLAEEILTFMKNQPAVIDGNIQGGFVNLVLGDEFFYQELAGWQIATHAPRSETIIVDYIGANIGKPLHIGHLCTPLFGQATVNILREQGYTVLSDMHQGDWGGIFGKLITGWKYFGDETAFERDPVDHLLQVYIRITEKVEQDGEHVEQECRNAFKMLSEGDAASVELWQKFTDKSLAGVRDIMAQFGVHPDIWVGESFYEGLPLPKLGTWPDLTADNTMSYVVRELIDRDIATQNEDSSVGVVFAPSDKAGTLPSCILQKRDGTHGYLASDLAAIKYRLKNWSPTRILYFVDNRQELHFKQVFATAKKAWISNSEGSGETCELTHAANGFVSLPDGAMSTRHGRIILLRDLVGESYERVRQILIDRSRELSESDTRAVALGAIVYSFLSQDRERDWVFEWDRVLAFDGNSGPYLQYTYVRWKKILDEIMSTYDGVTEETDLLTPFDRDVIMDILQAEDILAACGTSYKFHLIIAHLATTARHLNALYVNTPKLKDAAPKERYMRAMIVTKCLAMIAHVCAIVGIPLPEEM